MMFMPDRPTLRRVALVAVRTAIGTAAVLAPTALVLRARACSLAAHGTARVSSYRILPGASTRRLITGAFTDDDRGNTPVTNRA